MNDLTVSIDKIYDFVSKDEIFALEDNVAKCHQDLITKTGKGNDFLGWLDLPSKTGEQLIEKIEKEAKRLRNIAEVFVVIGIGGSYLGARAMIEAMSHHFQSLIDEKNNPVVLYAGQNISEDYLTSLLEVLDQREYAMAVISKSGTTTEPAIAFRILRRHIEKKYGREEASRRIIAITDKSKGALRQLSDTEGYSTYVVPDDVGGRFSVLSPVGLLPIAVSGLSIRKLINGAKDMQKNFFNSPGLYDNPAALYAVVRNALYNKGKQIEILATYHPEMYYFEEWWKQLYGESEGKENKGIFPAGVNFTSDLHSMGQYIQEGLRLIFETTLVIQQPKSELRILHDKDDLDGLNYISGKRLHEVNRMAELGTMLAHVSGGIPNIEITISRLNEQNLGRLIYFFEAACALSGYLLGVNPFDQPGVEAYKNNMFALLGKPGKQT